MVKLHEFHANSILRTLIVLLVVVHRGFAWDDSTSDNIVIVQDSTSSNKSIDSDYVAHEDDFIETTTTTPLSLQNVHQKTSQQQRQHHQYHHHNHHQHHHRQHQQQQQHQPPHDISHHHSENHISTVAHINKPPLSLRYHQSKEKLLFPDITAASVAAAAVAAAGSMNRHLTYKNRKGSNRNHMEHRYNIFQNENDHGSNNYGQKPKSKRKRYQNDDLYPIAQNHFFIPPYVKKYNKRYKQLFNLINGVMSSNPNNRQSAFGKVSKLPTNKSKWMEMNLFEDQRSYTPINTQSKELNNSQEKNEIPDDLLIDDRDYGFYKNSPKSKNFEYHRISTLPIGVTDKQHVSGVVRKQRLPVVAITNKRLAQPTNNHQKNHRADMEQNMFPLP